MNKGSYVILVQSQPDSIWKLSGWEDDLIEARHQADQLIQRPYLAHAVQVWSVGGSGHEPLFTLTHKAKVER